MNKLVCRCRLILLAGAFCSWVCGQAPKVADAGRIYKQGAPAVVTIEVFGADAKLAASGSGFLISADGKIVTNEHVIHDASRARVTLPSGAVYETVWVLDLNSQTDIAILKVDASHLPSLTPSCTSSPEVGDTVFSLSNPFGALENTLSEGIVSGIRYINGLQTFQISAPISHGSSGGPLLDVRGEVIGVTAATIAGGQNLNFAVPIRYVCELLGSGSAPKPLTSVYQHPPPGPGAPSRGLATPIGPPSAETETKTIDAHWFEADPKTVLADPRFQALSIPDRKRILTEIDPKFAKMSSSGQDSYLWNAEAEYLPKAPLPSRTFKWTPNGTGCEVSLSKDGKLTKTITADGIRVGAYVEKQGFFFSHIHVANGSLESVNIVPQTFAVVVRTPKPLTLRFEYPSRVSWRLLEAVTNSPPLITQEMFDYIRRIEKEALRAAILQPGEAAEGDVYFESDAKAREVILRVFAGDRAFEIPFTVGK